MPLLAGVALGLFQLCALPKPVAALVSPRTVQLRDELLRDEETPDSQAVTEPPIRYTLSFRPAATRYDLSLLVLSVAGFLMGSLLFCAARSRLLLCWAVAVNGALLAFFGLLQKLTWNGRIYWIGPRPSVESLFAAFVNRNNAGGYLNLCLAGAVVLMLWAANRDRRLGHRMHASRGPQPAGWPAHENFAERLANLDALQIGTGALAAIIVAGILCTLSRGAGIALLGSALVTALAVIATGKRQLRGGGGIIVLLAGVGLVGWVGMRDALVQRIGTLAEREELVSKARVPNWSDALRSVADFWPVGSGLGTYRDIYLLYQQRVDSQWYYYAENQYVQGLVEAGIPGLVLLLLAIAAAFFAVWRLLRSAADPLDYALAAGGLFAIVSQAIAGFFDFGLYLPPNLLLMAVLCGAVTQRAASEVLGGGFAVGGKVQVVLVAVFLLALVPATRQVRAIAATNTALNEADYPSSAGAATLADLRAAIDLLTARLPASSDDAELHYELAKAWIYLHRNQVLAELRRTAPPTESLAELWERASTTALHGHAYELLRAGKTQELDALRNDPLVIENLRPALQHLLLARQSCPILSKIHLRLARVCVVAAPPTCDAAHIRRARRLAPSDSYPFVETGLLDLQAGRIEDACRSWQHALTLSPEDLDDVLAYAWPALDLETIVAQVLPASPPLLLRLAKLGLPGIPVAESQPLLLRRIEQLVAAEGDVPADERQHLRAVVCVMRGDYAEALSAYESAVKMRPLEISWRHEYGQLLFQQGRLDDAHEQIRWCARRAPESPEYRQLLEAIHKARLAR